MAVLGLRLCARAFSSCGKRGPLFIAVRGPLTIAASLVAEHRLQTRRLSNCASRAQLLRGMWDPPRTRARTRVPCIGRQTLNHCATREAPKTHILIVSLPSERVHRTFCANQHREHKPFGFCKYLLSLRRESTHLFRQKHVIDYSIKRMIVGHKVMEKGATGSKIIQCYKNQPCKQN